MKKYNITIVTIITLSIFFLTSCNLDIDKAANQKEETIIIGNIDGNNISTANLTISLDSVAGLLKKYSRLTLEDNIYTYSRAWIEVLEVEQNEYNYYLGAEANVVSKNGVAASYYSIFTKLKIENTELMFLKNSTQHSCSGDCCNSCKLVIYEDGIGCKCNSKPNTKNCNGVGTCKHNKSEFIGDKEQKISDII